MRKDEERSFFPINLSPDLNNIALWANTAGAVFGVTRSPTGDAHDVQHGISQFYQQAALRQLWAHSSVGLVDRKELRKAVRTERCLQYRHLLEEFGLQG